MIDRFEGEYRFLSNFFPVDVQWGGLNFPSSEHAYQASKCRWTDERTRFMSGTAGQAKRMGKIVDRFPFFEENKLGMMEQILRIKFTNEALKAKLLATGDEELIEGNDWNDTFWGVCQHVGENHLGKILMKIRDEFRKENPNG